jgi:hypothetical protein
MASALLHVLGLLMSADFEKAIRFGATHVRVGASIFGAGGARDKSQSHSPPPTGPVLARNQRED